VTGEPGMTGAAGPTSGLSVTGEPEAILLPEPAGRPRGTGEGRVAVVTGAGRGIGAATLVALAAEGWSVLAVDSVADDPALPYPMSALPDLVAATELAVQYSGEPERVRPFIADVRDLAAMQSAIAQAEELWGGVDAAVAVAGVIAGGVPQWQLPVEHENAVLGVDLMGVLNLARASVPALLRRPEPRSGRFLAVTSAAASRGLPMLAAYCAAKAGVAGLIRALAVEFGDSGITANAVSPGSTDTAMLAETTRLYGLPGNGEFAEQQPMRRLLDPAEVANVLAFLASPASSGMTGAIVPVDAGLAL
jgi:SDR family mycofactocin-dependent oxidoreductase